MKKILLGLLVIILAAVGFVYVKLTSGVDASDLEDKYLTADDRFVDIEGARVRVRETGDANAQPVVLIHGFTHSLETWEGWAEALGSEYRVIRYDLLGHGLTGPDPKERYAPTERAAFIGNVLDALEIESAFVAGNSLGGLAAWRFTADNPERVDGLMLISSGAFPLNGAGDEPAEIPAAMKAFLLTAPEAGVRASAELIYGDDSKVTDERIASMRDMIAREGNGPALIKSLEEFTLPDPVPALQSIMTPTLVMWGESDVIISIEQGEKIVEAIPNAKMVTYPGVGHAAQEEAPSATVRDAIAFMNDVRGNSDMGAE